MNCWHKRAIAALAALVVPVGAGASGFEQWQHSAAGLGSAFAAGVTGADDASSLFENPATMLELEQTTMSLNAVSAEAPPQFSDEGSTDATLLGGNPLGGDTQSAPTGTGPRYDLFYVHRHREQLRIGFGLYRPFATQINYGDTWTGRYHLTRASLQAFSFSPAIAFQVRPRLSLGFAIEFHAADLDLNRAVDFGAVCVAQLDPVTCAGQGTGPQQVDGSERHLAGNGRRIASGLRWGVLYRYGTQTWIGAGYRSQMRYEFRGQRYYEVPAAAGFATGDPRYDTVGIQSTVVMPPVFSVGVRRMLTPDLALAARLTRVGWKKMQELRIRYDDGSPDQVTTLGFNNSQRMALGASWHMTENWQLRAGWALDRSPVAEGASHDPLMPVGDRQYLTLGLGWRVGDTLQLDLGLARYEGSDTGTDTLVSTDDPWRQARLHGSYRDNGNIAALQAKLNF